MARKKKINICFWCRETLSSPEDKDTCCEGCWIAMKGGKNWEKFSRKQKNLDGN